MSFFYFLFTIKKNLKKKPPSPLFSPPYPSFPPSLSSSSSTTSHYLHLLVNFHHLSSSTQHSSNNNNNKNTTTQLGLPISSEDFITKFDFEKFEKGKIRFLSLKFDFLFLNPATITKKNPATIQQQLQNQET